MGVFGELWSLMGVSLCGQSYLRRRGSIGTGGSGSLGFSELEKFSMVCSPSPSQRIGSSGLTSPVQHGQATALDPHDRQGGWNGGVDEGAGAVAMEAAIDTEATIARDTFVGMLETVSRTKDSIGRTTRQAMDCAKHGLAEQVGLVMRVGLWMDEVVKWEFVCMLYQHF